MIAGVLWLWTFVQTTQPALLAVPVPRLDGMEPAVARQLGDVQRRLDEALSRHDADGALFGESGRYYQAYGIADAAEACYRNASALSPAEFRWPYLLGVLLAENGRLAEAASLLGGVLAGGTGYYPAYLRLSSIYLALGETDKAASLLGAARSHAPDDPAGLAIEGELMLNRREYAQAAELLSRALVLQPRATRLHYPLGIALRELGRIDEARDHLSRAGATGVKPRDPVVDDVFALRQGESSFMMDGHAAYRAGDMPGAAQAFQRALEASNGTSVSALINLAATENALGRGDEALAHLRRAMELDPKNGTAPFNIGILHAAAGRHHEAAEAFAAALALQPDDQAARASMGIEQIAEGRVRDGLLALEALTAVPAGRCGPLLAALATLSSNAGAGVAGQASRLRQRLSVMPGCRVPR